MADRAVFLAGVRKALGHAAGGAAPAPVEVPAYREEVIRQVAMADAGRVERWEKLAKRNGMTVERVTESWIGAAIDRALTLHQAARVMVNVSEAGLRGNVLRGLAKEGRTVGQWGDADCRNEVYRCEASVTDVRFGLADTGALLVWSEAGFGRSTTLTVPLHIVMLRAGKILGDMVDGLAEVRKAFPEKMPSNVVVINGPSKTADIEMNLVTGVHGPKFIHVLLVAG